jgi:hypothetical protein
MHSASAMRLTPNSYACTKMHGGTRAMNNQPTPTLEQRIASALNAAAITSSDLDTLIAESEAADLAAAKAREAALDPAVVADTAKMGAAVATATLSRDRLQAALPRLQQQLKQAREREYTAAWREDFKRVEAKRDAPAAEYAETYPQVVERLVDLLHCVEACDREVSHINRSAPSGARAHLCEVELTARGIEQLLLPDVVTKELRLPKFKRGANEPLLAWPPPPNLALQIAAIRTDPFLNHEAAKNTYVKERDRRILEDNRRQILEAEQRQREFAQRKAAGDREVTVQPVPRSSSPRKGSQPHRGASRSNIISLASRHLRLALSGRASRMVRVITADAVRPLSPAAWRGWASARLRRNPRFARAVIRAPRPTAFFAGGECRLFGEDRKTNVHSEFFSV